MAPPKRKTGGRVTPSPSADQSSNRGPAASSRYTPPVPQEEKIGKPWVPVLMLVLLIVGVIVIMLRNLAFAGNNWLLLIGLGSILGGLYTATKWR
ncbi:MAG: cell division protein CrgA [Ilumatobacteraceae bacterium]|nr:cell division protein CrgA [Ilumatobacteraceae bacterium]